VQLGFDLQLLGSARYIQSKLEALSTEQIRLLKSAFIKSKHLRFKKEFSGAIINRLEKQQIT
jgi:hypothetical protein